MWLNTVGSSYLVVFFFFLLLINSTCMFMCTFVDKQCFRRPVLVLAILKRSLASPLEDQLIIFFLQDVNLRYECMSLYGGFLIIFLTSLLFSSLLFFF